MRVLDLFSGIGGFSLGLERAGMETVAFCEIEDYPVKILNKHWPDIPVHRDIRKLDGKQYRDSVELVCGGFPCQPFSVAGKQRGKEDDRHLWPEMLRIIKECKPTWVIGENVAGFIRMALDDVLLDLETEGFTTQSFVVPACAVGAIHRRDRVWIIAHSESNRDLRADRKIQGEDEKQQTQKEPGKDEAEQHGNGGSGDSELWVSSDTKHNGRNGSKDGQSNTSRNDGDKEGQNETKQSTGPGCEGGDDANAESKQDRGLCEQRLQPNTSAIGGAISDTDNERLQRASAPRHLGSEGQKAIEQLARLHDFFRQKFKPLGLPAESPVCHRDDGVPDRVARLKALGNSVVPQIPELIGRAIMEVENAIQRRT